MSEANLIFKYKEFKFNISVNMNVRMTRGIPSRRWHKVVINDMGVGNWIKKLEVEDPELEGTISNFKQEAINYVNGFEKKTKDQLRLESLGFNS